MSIAFAALLLAQISGGTPPTAIDDLFLPSGPSSDEAPIASPDHRLSAQNERMAQCLIAVRENPATAVATASAWAGDVGENAAAAEPLLCLALAYSALERWSAAADAFAEVRDLKPAADALGRVRYGQLAGTTLLRAGETARAVALLERAENDAQAGALPAIAGSVALDLAAAQALAGRAEAAAAALARAREAAPGDAETWLRSAAFAREAGDLAQAQDFVLSAAALAPRDAAVGLEAGIIAALARQDEAARLSFASVIDIDPDGPEGGRARAYLAQLEEPVAP